MEITKGKLKQIIREEMYSLAENGDISLLTESEKKAFQIILDKLTADDLRYYGLKKIS